MAEPVFKLKLKLQPKQKQLLHAIMATGPDVQTVLGYGGSRGAAKSGGVRRIALLLAAQQSGLIIWIVRRIWDDLNKDHVKPLFQECPELEQFYRATDHELRLPANGGGTSSIFFIHSGDSGRSKRKARGPQAHFIFIEQAEEFSQEEIEQYDGSNRAPGVPPGFCKKILTFNPGGIGTNYLRRVMWKREFRENESPDNFAFIQGFGWDNYEWFRALNKWTFEEFYALSDEERFDIFIHQTDFGRKLNSLPPAQRIGELMGSFENFSGQYYADVWEQSTIVLPADIVARIIKPWWRRWIATDWGFSHYAATGWLASGYVSVEEAGDFFGVRVEAPIRTLILYRELVCCDLPEPDLARLIVSQTPEAEKREIRYHFIGQDAWAKRGSANTVVEQMEPILLQGGLQRLDKADWDRPGGWRLIYNAFASARRLRKSADAFSEDQADVPALFISQACPEVCQAIPMLISDYDPITRPQGNVQDVRKMPGQVTDDVADMLRYGLKSYLAAEPGRPIEVERSELASRYQPTAEGNTAKMLAMLKFNADQERGQVLRRQLRGR